MHMGRIQWRHADWSGKRLAAHIPGSSEGANGAANRVTDFSVDTATVKSRSPFNFVLNIPGSRDRASPQAGSVYQPAIEHNELRLLAIRAEAGRCCIPCEAAES